MGEPEAIKTDGMLHRPCKKCGCPLVFAMGPNGKLIPLDLRAQVYTLTEDLMGQPTAQPLASARVSHFYTCPEANHFSWQKKKKR